LIGRLDQAGRILHQDIVKKLLSKKAPKLLSF
jgi:hypothetical protein